MDGSGPRDPNIEEVNSDEFVGGVVSFGDYLLEQLAMLDISDEVELAARAIVGSLDEDGFFVSNCAEIARITGLTGEIAEKALAVVQQLDPPGVGARSVREALLLQAETIGVTSAILTSHHRGPPR